MHVHLHLIIVSCVDDRLQFLLAPSYGVKTHRHSFFSTELKDGFYMNSAVKSILSSCFSSVDVNERELWLNSARCRDRIIDVYDGDLLYTPSAGISIVRCVAVPMDFASKANGVWRNAEDLLSDPNGLSHDEMMFLSSCMRRIELWVRNSTFAFELLTEVFAIHDLRSLLCLLSNQEIDPGNFHRRLKRLDILKPVGLSQQRVHRWQFEWERGATLRTDGLIP